MVQKGLTHFQHGTLLKQDVNVARVSSWLHAESMKSAPRICKENDVELTKKLKETISQSDSLLKLGQGGNLRLGVRSWGGGLARGGLARVRGRARESPRGGRSLGRYRNAFTANRK